MNEGSHNNPPPSPHMPRDDNNNTSSHNTAGFSTRRTTRNKELDKKIQQMALPLAPLVQLTSGHVHPSFPSTLLNFWLLTDAQLDELAQFYHQRSPCQWTRHYPCPISWAEGLTLEEKRRKIGKFIGLRGVSFSTPFTFLLSGFLFPWSVTVEDCIVTKHHKLIGCHIVRYSDSPQDGRADYGGGSTGTHKTRRGGDAPEQDARVLLERLPLLVSLRRVFRLGISFLGGGGENPPPPLGAYHLLGHGIPTNLSMTF